MLKKFISVFYTYKTRLNSLLEGGQNDDQSSVKGWERLVTTVHSGLI